MTLPLHSLMEHATVERVASAVRDALAADGAA
jgi:hypothetical protein